MKTEFLTEDVTDTYFGRTLTICLDRIIGPDYKKDQLLFHLNYNLQYDVYIHDDKYFILNQNSLALPTKFLMIYPRKELSQYYELAMKQHIELNIPQDPCEEDPGYIFQGCIKEYLAGLIGCRTTWDSLSDQSRNLCTTVEQYRFFKNKVKLEIKHIKNID